MLYLFYMSLERSVSRKPSTDDVVLTRRGTAPSPIRSAELLTEYEWGMVRRLPLLERDQRKLQREAADCLERFQIAARNYRTYHPEVGSMEDSIDAWARIEVEQPVEYRRLVQELLIKAGEILSPGAMLLVKMHKEAHRWLELHRRIRRIEDTIQTITPLAKRVGRAQAL